MAGGTNGVQSILGAESFLEYEREIIEKHQLKAEEEIIWKIQQVLEDVGFLAVLKAYGQKVACSFIGWRKVNIRLSSGRSYKVNSPVFLRARPKDRRRRRRRCDVVRHLGLEVLGFQHKCSPLLLHHSIQLAALCPSFDTATEVLKSLGIRMNHRLLQELCYRVADRVMEHRCENVVDDVWQTAGLRILVCIDAGRLRRRQRRRGPKKKGAVRHSYSTDWVAPWMITITCVDEKGNKRKEVSPIYDGTVKDINGAFELLGDYLKQINIKEAEAVTFCADGGTGIWERVEKLAQTLEAETIYKVLDYTHAKQNLQEIVELLHQGHGICDYEYKKVAIQLKNHLWEGEIDAIDKFICKRLHGKRQKKKALKKLHNYFEDTAKFQYKTYRACGIPIGSGTVESAVRRVINLRIKSPGQFWKLENAERMIFLRSQVLSKRWYSVLTSALERRTNSIYSRQLHQEKMVA